MFLNIIFGYMLFSLMINVNGHYNKCFDCVVDIHNCRPPKDLFKFTVPQKDSTKAIPSVNASGSESELDKCIKPGVNLTGVLNGVLCSITKDKTCGVISNNYNDEGAVCWACAAACQCDPTKFSKAVREDLTSVIYLESLQIVLYISGLIIY
ncbi:uncharacterized protein LOC26527732 [Drosophila mojavensis]|uniref:Uncharacterized protein n=1 Tax=Drosophila mojavensis TaxID=7230 RepID=A0A0Q9XI00_DROMO|nr:uncharacterized protein LOC26527732 [Drosophila mojavensis]KRG05466.1 uncharacterized protein Dmoj_GI26091 [Drosophila mojavensis]